ncbi:MAG: hypothetical protein AAF533_02020 [Acidobacteriota bacterium]
MRLTILVFALLTGLATNSALAYPDTKAECDEAGGAWVGSSSTEGFCFMKLEPMEVAVTGTTDGRIVGIVLDDGPGCLVGPRTIQHVGGLTESCSGDSSLFGEATHLVEVTLPKGEIARVPGGKVTAEMREPSDPTPPPPPPPPGALISATVHSHPTRGAVLIGHRVIGQATHLQARRPGDVVARDLVVGPGETVLVGTDAVVSGDLHVDDGRVLFLPGSRLLGAAVVRGAAVLVLDGATVEGDLQASSRGDFEGHVAARGSNLLGTVTTGGLELLSLEGCSVGALSSTDDLEVELNDNNVQHDLTVTNGQVMTLTGNVAAGSLSFVRGEQTRSLLVQ